MKAEAQERGVLGSILESTGIRVAALSRSRIALERAAARAPDPRPFVPALAGPNVAVIAEVKKRSPSAGVIREGADAAGLAAIFEAAGAAAISVLTEPERFGGDIEDLRRVAAAVKLPVLRKDFIIDEVQLFEARAAGASAVLLIVRALPGAALRDLAAAAARLGLATLVEVHGGAELELALAVAPGAVGINARDLESLAMNAAAAEDLIARVPVTVPAVAESGLKNRGDVERVAARGADAVLIGTALAGAADPAAALAPLTSVARCPRGEQS